MYKCYVSCMIEGFAQPQFLKRERIAATPVAALMLACERLIKDVSLYEVCGEKPGPLVNLVAMVLRVVSSSLETRSQSETDDKEVLQNANDGGTTTKSLRAKPEKLEVPL